jgi:hypothetical protein
VASSEYPGEQHPKFATFQLALEWCASQITGAATARHQPHGLEYGNTEGIHIEVVQTESGKDGELNVDGALAEVGHWGEDYAFGAWIQQVSEQYSQSSEVQAIPEQGRYTLLQGETPLAEVYWRNALGESGSSPDLILTEKSHKKFIEVKTTRLRTARIRLTRCEYELALKEGENYCLAVVRQAMSPEAYITTIWDPVRVFGLAAPSEVTPVGRDESATQPPGRPKARAVRTATYKFGEVRDSSGRIACQVMLQIDEPGSGRIFVCRRTSKRLVFVVDQEKSNRTYGEVLSPIMKARAGQTDVHLLVHGGHLHQQITAIREALR